MHVKSRLALRSHRILSIHSTFCVCVCVLKVECKRTKSKYSLTIHNNFYQTRYKGQFILYFCYKRSLFTRTAKTYNKALVYKLKKRYNRCNNFTLSIYIQYGNGGGEWQGISEHIYCLRKSITQITMPEFSMSLVKDMHSLCVI